jgi:hypothetical protein
MTDPGGAAAPTAPGNFNLPNLITVVRILLAPVFFWLLLADAGADGVLRWIAAALFILAIATDGIDGAIARRRGMVTDLGKILDPVADKLLTSGALVCLSILGELWCARSASRCGAWSSSRVGTSCRPGAAASSRPSRRPSPSRSRSPRCGRSSATVCSG